MFPEEANREWPGLRRRCQVPTLSTILGPQKPMPRTIEDFHLEEFPELLHPFLRRQNCLVHARVVAAVETKHRGLNRSERLAFG